MTRANESIRTKTTLCNSKVVGSATLCITFTDTILEEGKYTTQVYNYSRNNIQHNNVFLDLYICIKATIVGRSVSYMGQSVRIVLSYPVR